RKLLSISVKMDLGIWKELVKNSWPLTLSIVFVGILSRIDQLMLFQMKGKEELGFYAAAVKLAEYPFMIAGAFLASIFPLLFEHGISSPDIFKRIYRITLKYLMIFIIPLAVATTLYSKQIILACYGRSFLPSQLALAILIWSTAFGYAGLVHSNLLIATNLQLFDIIFTGFPALLNVILNLILIPRYSFIGAAIATTISYGLYIPISYSLKRTRVFAIAIVRSMIKPLLVSLFVIYLVHFLSPLNLIFNLILSLFIYLFLIFLMGEINATDIKYAKEILFGSAA
ncbi:MAG: polysaccharide biosynthesis C-terminal domain-containing protein, partial [Candidatus Omnitrophota bacterium]|nr:polysaccharide biosynthesis C-terminal domain-containing protein [Candidatus Omnitrophota bacterium]